MSECSHDCASCKENCSSRDPKSFLVAPKETSHIKKVIGVVSGKGGVGKSLVTSLLAAGMQRRNAQSAILDADITGPSIPKSFGVNHERAMGTDEGILPVYTPGGIKVMSLNLLLDDETQPVIWRGSMISGVVTQFWSDVLWEDVDYMFVDMPPGTGDVPLTVFQSLPVDGIIVVTSPQELVSLIVTKAINMANTMNIPVLGLVENFSFVECPDCGKKIPVFGESHIDEEAKKLGIDVLAKMPIDPKLTAAVDAGRIELFESAYTNQLCDAFEAALSKLHRS
jgi:Mrp family chromosome partitioning ATPase